jgi:uncharacterized RDD family membrane protein YckC
VICPRCGRESAGRGAFCAGCGAPLALPDEAAPRPLDRDLPIDRRADRAPPSLETTRTVPAPARARRLEPGPAAAAVLAELEASAPGWELGAPLPGSPEPAPGPLAPADTGAFVWGAPAADAAEDGAAEDAPARRPREIHLRRPATWRRAAAWAIDLVPLAAATVALGRSLLASARAGLPAPPTGLDGFLDLLARESLIVGSLAALLVLALGVYATLAHGLGGATLGKWILGLRVVGPGGARPTLARSAARSALALVSAGLLGAGFLLALFTASGRSLHDLLARTWVVEAP